MRIALRIKKINTKQTILFRNRYLFCLLSFFLALTFQAIAQDLIIKNEGRDTIKCKIIEDKIIFLLYNLLDSLDNATYKINSTEYDYYVKGTKKEQVDSLIEADNENKYDKFQQRNKGAYYTFESFKNNTPDVSFEFTVIHRSNFDIGMNGGNDYKIKSLTKDVTKHQINKEFWAVCDDQYCYLNCKKVLIYKYYSFIHFEKDYAFVIALPRPKDRTQDISIYPMFGVAGAVMAAKEALIRFQYKLDLTTGAVSLIR